MVGWRYHRQFGNGLECRRVPCPVRIGPEAAILKTEQTFIRSGADFTLRTMNELTELIERINGMLAEGKDRAFSARKPLRPIDMPVKYCGNI